ncbi:MAG: phosphoethanolamine transferase [Chlorobaculum sp.]|nr:phosphoethanolamine transferase [Chlorobaculum sp.]
MDGQILEIAYKIRLFQNLFFVGMIYFSIMFFSRRKWSFSAIAFLVGVLWLVYVPSISLIIGNLGMDSIDETKRFDNKEALFWISTIIHSVRPFPNTFLYFTGYVALSAVTAYLLNLILKKAAFAKWRYFIQTMLSAVLIVCSLVVVFRDSVLLFARNSNEQGISKKNFENQIPAVCRSDKNIDVIVFIGESLSVFDMGVYGYPRNTTPYLSRMAQGSRNILVFHNVFSTHTHTSLSLLEALSFPVERSENYLPIIQRKRVSLVDVLRKGGVRTRLISNQGMIGTWSEASAIIFKNADTRVSIDSHAVGNTEQLPEKPWGHIFFMKHLADDHNSNNSAQPVVTFLHSYAGHGPYLEGIPEEFRTPVDNYFSVNTSKKISESGIDVREQIEGYDSALRYVDFTVSRIIDFIDKQKKPTILVLFSDHGESVYTGRGHDSARFIHEMARIPFIIYFNDAAIKKYPDLYQRYRTLSETREIATLAQLSSVIADISGIRFKKSDTLQYLSPLIGEPCVHSPIIVREVKSGLTYIDLNKTKPAIPPNLKYHITDATDPATAEFVRTRGQNIPPDKRDDRSTTSLERQRRNELIYGE